MTLDTIFDLASLTKVVATTTSVMKLVEEGRIRLNDPVAHVHSRVRALRQERHHHPPSADAHVRACGPTSISAIEWTAYDDGDRAARSTRCRPRRPASASSTATSTSSCSATSSAASAASRSIEFAREHIFEPLGMKDTMFLPPESLRAAHRADRDAARRSAWPCDGPDMHDAARRRPRSDGAADGRRRRARRAVQHRRRPVASSAACCSTAARSDGARILSPLTVAQMTTPATPPGDARTCAGSAGTSTPRYSSNRGELFPIGSFGHTGFTGTSLWIDPATKTLRRLPVEPRPPGRQGRRDAAARAGSRRSRPSAIDATPRPRPRGARLHDRPRLRRRGRRAARARRGRRC